MPRVPFQSVFRVHPDGGIEPLRRVRIGGIQFGPGVIFGRGIAIGGVDLAKYAQNDLEIHAEGDLTVVDGAYNL